MESNSSKYRVNLEFKNVRLPPVRDILVLGKKYPHGKAGVMECFRFIAPDEFEMFDIPEDDVAAEAVVIHRRILDKMPAEQVIAILRDHVFPFMSVGEAINVDFDVTISILGLEVPRNQ